MGQAERSAQPWGHMTNSHDQLAEGQWGAVGTRGRTSDSSRERAGDGGERHQGEGGGEDPRRENEYSERSGHLNAKCYKMPPMVTEIS